MKTLLLVITLAVASAFAQQTETQTAPPARTLQIDAVSASTVLAPVGVPVVASPIPDPVNPGGFLAQIADPANITIGAYVLSQIADSTTDWHFTVAGKQYSVSPARRTAFAGGTLGAAIALAHYFPKAKKPVTVALVAATSIFAGRAYANTLNHGAPPGGNVAALSSKYSFAIRLH